MLKLNAFQLKWVAIIGMILNHIAIGLWEILPVGLAIPLYIAGGFTFPIMAFFVVEGYKHTSNIKRYLFRLFIFGVIAIPFHMLAFRAFALNIMFTIIAGMLCLMLYDKIKNRFLFWALFALITILTAFPIMFDWFIVGVIMILLCYIIKNEKIRRVLPPIIGGLFFLLISLMMIVNNDNPYFMMPHPYDDIVFAKMSALFIIGCIGGAVLVANYNGERGKRMKWLFYAFYPVHLAVIGLIALALGYVSLGIFGL